MKKSDLPGTRPRPPADFDDNPPLDAATLRNARPAAEVVPHIVDGAKRRAGRPPLKGKAKVAISLRLDPDILDAFKATGKGWQSRINAALAKSVAEL